MERRARQRPARRWGKAPDSRRAPPQQHRAQHHVDQLGLGGGDVLALQLRLAQHQAHLGGEVGVGLRGGPQHHHQVARIHRPAPALVGPAAELRRVGLQGRDDAALDLVGKVRRAGDHLVGIDARIVRVLEGKAQLARDVFAQGGGGVVLALAQRIHVRQPDVEHAAQHGAVQQLLARVVVQQVLLRKPGGGSDAVDGHAAVTLLREQRLGRTQNALLDFGALRRGVAACAGSIAGLWHVACEGFRCKSGWARTAALS
jgi:hypothetical protein